MGCRLFSSRMQLSNGILVLSSVPKKKTPLCYGPVRTAGWLSVGSWSEAKREELRFFSVLQRQGEVSIQLHLKWGFSALSCLQILLMERPEWVDPATQRQEIQGSLKQG